MLQDTLLVACDPQFAYDGRSRLYTWLSSIAKNKIRSLHRKRRPMPTDSHAETHLLPWNMYQQIGETQKAIAAWSAGLAVFPDNSDLAAQLALVQSGDH